MNQPRVVDCRNPESAQWLSVHRYGTLFVRERRLTYRHFTNIIKLEHGINLLYNLGDGYGRAYPQA